MNKSYRVFTGAPPPTWERKIGSVSWKTVSSREVSPPLLPMTIEQAGHRVSLVYKNVIFEDDDQENEADELENQNSIDILPTKAADLSEHHDVTYKSDNLSYLRETYETDHTGDETTMLSEGSSISRFPTFNFSLDTISSLSSLMQPHISGSTCSKLTLLLGILEIDGPSYVKVKTGRYAGSEVALLKLIVGDDTGVMCKIVAWRETAELWGGVDTDPGLKRGDITLFESVMVSRRPEGFEDSESKLQITASPNLKSQAQICYRTLPETHEDRKFRPDLRLADSVPSVRRVGEVVRWMEQMAGTSPKP